VPPTAGSLPDDVSARALVVAVLDGRALDTSAICRQAERLVAEGADILELSGGTVDHIRAVRTVVAVPLAVADLATAHATGALLVAHRRDGAVAAAHAGIAPNRIVLDVTPSLRPHADDLNLGYRLLASTATTTCPPGADGRDYVLAAAAVAISNGCRLVRTVDIRGVARVRDVLAAVLAATDVPAPTGPAR